MCLSGLGSGPYFAALPKAQKWREALAVHPSVREADAPGYNDRLRRFMQNKGGVLAQLDEVAV
ncbi:hypothetical protein MKP05_05120 [Halomonas sp. EGI 63088]|uniref:Uncharacterized protein n=1 Tax=Halomonas flagellata TaxID=2920385 RepID=A0ABS9RRS5_9GAMM|nr:hypothetical protein [Halomonas flagellata]MCH4562516.1 hypothetical protein [Halomonas flagellata]